MRDGRGERDDKNSYEEENEEHETERTKRRIKRGRKKGELAKRCFRTETLANKCSSISLPTSAANLERKICLRKLSPNIDN